MTGRRLRWTAVGAVGAATTILLTAGPALADATTAQPAEGSTLTASDLSLNLLWVLIGAVLVIFMQAGFALVETGFCRAKHAAHVVSTNFAIFGLGFVAFFAVGFSFMFGGYSLPIIGYNEAIGGSLIGSGDWTFLYQGGFFLSGDGVYDVSVLTFFLYMVAFMDTVATIPTGAMAERWKWNSFVIWGLFCGAIYYPLFGAWTWGGGWLAALGRSASLGKGYVDFAGSGVVHMMGGVAALAGAIVLGPRKGKFGPDGKPRVLAAHHIPMAMLGCFILLFGWFGFNAASTFGATDNRFGVVAANTAIAGAFGAVVSMLYMMLRTKKPDPGMMVNGMLAGLVAITAPCAFVQPWAAAVIGIIAGVLVIEAAWFVERRGIDDPVGAVAVHGVHGCFGVLAVGIFADGSYGGDWNATGSETLNVHGLLYGGDGGGQFVAQLLGALTVATVMFGIAFAFFKIQNKLTPGGIRSKEADEDEGLDLPEMGVLAYAEFYGSSIHVEMSGPGGSHTPMAEPTAVGQERSR